MTTDKPIMKQVNTVVKTPYSSNLE